MSTLHPPAMSARRRRALGYTVVEVMVALSILAVGASGIFALQKATLIGNNNAKILALANSIATTWAERLRADALQWNDPAGVPDIAGTAWLSEMAGQPYPTRFTPISIVGLGTAEADILGTDVYPGDTYDIAFCTHLRFRQFTAASGGTPLWPNLIRVEIRVFWERNGSPIDCTTPPGDVDAEPDRYGAVYLATSVLQNKSPL